ncbi:unnamed protein product [Lathyrus sativus]|nr:unnamed protein product [Lathyrus sativus]
MASLTGFITAIIITIILAGSSAGRDLRPSDHGLGYQSSPPANSPPDMRSFFNSNNSSSDSSSDAFNWNATDSAPPALPRSTGNGRRRLGKALVIGSLLCGVTGVTLLVVSCLLCVFGCLRVRRNSEQNDSFRHGDDNFNLNNNNNDNNDNKLEVVRTS